MEFSSVSEILDFAIKKEQDAADFYSGLANRVSQKNMKEALLEFAGEELEHKKKLISIKEGKTMLKAEKQVLDLKIGESLDDVEVSDDLSYQEALILAMKSEKSAFKLYSDLASAVDDTNLRETFLGLAQEEAMHKLRFETEYDNNIFKEN